MVHKMLKCISHELNFGEGSMRDDCHLHELVW